MRLLSLLPLICVVALLVACEPRQRDTVNLPWKTEITETGANRVFGAKIGEDSLKQLSIQLKHIADTALFETPVGKLSVESYFGKVLIGLLEGRFIADLEADEAFLQAERRKAADRKATPNNNWKYQLSLEGAAKIVDMKVWRLVYLPTGQYEEKQINFFGKPAETIKVTETAEYRLFPDKGIAVLWDTKGGEIFYYVAPKDFDRLKASLPMEAITPENRG